MLWREGPSPAASSTNALEQERLEADQRLGLVRLGDEGVRHAPGTECERTGLQRQARVADIDGELAVEDVEPLVLVRVHVPGRALAGTYGDLDQSVLALGVGAADLDDLEHPEQPVRIALVLAEQIPVLCTVWRNDGHLLLLPWEDWYSPQL